MGLGDRLSRPLHPWASVMILPKRCPLPLIMLILLACHPGNPAATLSPAYPELLREANIASVYRFSVGLDSAGVPDLASFNVISATSFGFDLPVRRAVAVWRPEVPRGTTVVMRTVVFVLLPQGADSVRDCPRPRSFTLVCAHEPRMVSRDEATSR